MAESKQSKRRYFTKAQIAKIFKPDGPIKLIEIDEDRCDVICWNERMRAKARPFNVQINDVDLRKSYHSSVFKLRICNVPVKNDTVNNLFIRHFFHIKIVTGDISITEVSALVNDWNMEFAVVKTVLLNITDEGFGFCSEVRCHITDTNEILGCYNQYKSAILRSPGSIASRIEYYLGHKEEWDWAKKSVKPDEIDNYRNQYSLFLYQGLAVDL